MKMIFKRIYYAGLVVVILLGMGTAFYNVAEKWSLIDSFYFSTMTLTTIGYGDFAPRTDIGKLFTSFYALFGIGIMLYILSSVIGVAIFRQQKHVRHFLRSIKKISKQKRKVEAKEKQLSKAEQKIEKVERKLTKQEREIKTAEKKLSKQEQQLQKQAKKLKKKKRPG